MDRKSVPDCVLCRSCANFVGRATHPERRRARPRLCAAGVPSIPELFACDSFVPGTAVKPIEVRVNPGR